MVARWCLPRPLSSARAGVSPVLDPLAASNGGLCDGETNSPSTGSTPDLTAGIRRGEAATFRHIGTAQCTFDLPRPCSVVLVVLVVTILELLLDYGEDAQEAQASHAEHAPGPEVDPCYQREAEADVCTPPPSRNGIDGRLAMDAVRGVLRPTVEEDRPRVDGWRQRTEHVCMLCQPLTQRGNAPVGGGRHEIARHGGRSLSHADRLLLVVEEGQVRVQKAIGAQMHDPHRKQSKDLAHQRRLLGRWGCNLRLIHGRRCNDRLSGALLRPVGIESALGLLGLGLGAAVDNGS